MNLNAAKFNWSNDLLQRNRNSFAFYTFDNGFGWVTNTDSVAYDERGKQIIFASQNLHNTTSDALLNGEAYLQCMFDEYLKY